MDSNAQLSRYQGTLLGVAVGDALGAPVEGTLRIAREIIDSLQPEPGELRYTDDTHMTIGVAQSLIACRGFDGPQMARVFAENFRMEPWRGYGAGPPCVCESILRGGKWDEPARQLFGGAGSLGNGAAMRVAPVALFAAGDFDPVAEIARQTARITHAHELGTEGAVVQACAVALSLESDANARLSPARFLASLRRHVTGALSGARVGEEGIPMDVAHFRRVRRVIAFFGRECAAINAGQEEAAIASRMGVTFEAILARRRTLVLCETRRIA